MKKEEELREDVARVAAGELGMKIKKFSTFSRGFERELIRFSRVK